MVQSSPAKDWCFTINNPTEKDWKAVWKLQYQYLVCQPELAESGTPHLQGFVQMQEKLRLSALSKLLKHAHLSKRRGTPYEAAHYCMKPVPACKCKHCEGLERFDNYTEDGYMTAELHASVHAAAACIKEHGLKRGIDRFPNLYLQYPRGFKALASASCPLRHHETQVTVLWGTSGAGKTRYAMDTFPNPYMLPPFGDGTDFFGDYDPLSHKTVIVDEFYSNWKYGTFLRACDRYPMEAHTKGDFVQFLADDIVFTSNTSPYEWYPNVLVDPIRRVSFLRRIHNIIEFTPAGYIIRKGHMPYAVPEWLKHANVNEVLGNAQPAVPLSEEYRARRREWYSAHRQ